MSLKEQIKSKAQELGLRYYELSKSLKNVEDRLKEIEAYYTIFNAQEQDQGSALKSYNAGTPDMAQHPVVDNLPENAEVTE